ncbi:MAG: Gfo/Idh/MocA family oxidoreductase [bacterium]
MGLDNKLSVGVIGLGHWGPNVVRNFARHPRVRLISVCDISKSAFHRVSDLLPEACQFTTEASRLINNPDIDAVVIVTPASTHYNLIRESLIAKKHVLGEKPLALDIGQGQNLCKLAEQSKLKLMVGFTFLFNNGIRKLKELIGSERLGRLYYLTATRTHIGLIRQDISVVWDLAPHDISIMNYLIGTFPERVSAVGANPISLNRSDFAFINLFYPCGIVGQIHVSWINSNKERVVRVIGSKARAEFDDLNNLEPIRIFEKGIGIVDRVEPDYGGFQFLLRDGDIISPKVEMVEPLKQMVDTFVNVVLDDAENISDGRFGAEVTRVLVAIHRSMLSGGASQDVS